MSDPNIVVISAEQYARLTADDELPTCWLNEDCVAGYHAAFIECRYPSWGTPTPWAHPATMIGRAS